MKPLQTTRQTLNRIRWQTAVIATAGLCLYVVGLDLCAGAVIASIYHGHRIGEPFLMSLGARLQLDGVPLLVGGVTVFGCAVAGRWIIARCQLCQKRLDQLFFCGGYPWRISPTLRACPFCRGSLDALPTTYEKS